MDNHGDADQVFRVGLDRRSFLRATGAVAASTIGAGLAIPAFAQQGGPASTERLVSGRRKLGKLEENIGAAAIELTAEDFCEIERGAAGIEMQGERLPQALLNMVGR